MTKAENVLWEALKGKQLDGLKFRAQHPVGPFILDYWCPARKLVVEVDGGVHRDQHDYDETRTKQLESYGYRVIRFNNDQVLADLPSVLEKIREAANSSPPPTPQLLGEPFLASSPSIGGRGAILPTSTPPSAD